jgi:hypothetical protein
MVENREKDPESAPEPQWSSWDPPQNPRPNEDPYFEDPYYPDPYR